VANPSVVQGASEGTPVDDRGCRDREWLYMSCEESQGRGQKHGKRACGHHHGRRPMTTTARACLAARHRSWATGRLTRVQSSSRVPHPSGTDQEIARALEDISRVNIAISNGYTNIPSVATSDTQNRQPPFGTAQTLDYGDIDRILYVAPPRSIRRHSGQLSRNEARNTASQAAVHYQHHKTHAEHSLRKSLDSLFAPIQMLVMKSPVNPWSTNQGRK
jgi:hypothetical protein